MVKMNLSVLYNRVVLVSLGILFVLGYSPVFCGNLRDKSLEHGCLTEFEGGSIDWAAGIVKATGRALPLGKNRPDMSNRLLEEARADAVSNLISILKGLPLKTGVRIEDAAKSDILLSGIEQTALDAEIVEQRYTSHRAMEVTLKTQIFGGFLQLVLPDDIKQISSIHLLEPERKMQWEKRCTGLVIDVGDIGFQPVLYPVIVSETGQEIFSSMFISREYAVQHGVCRYVCADAPDAITKRVGFNPLVIRGLRKGGAENASIIISSADAERIESLIERHLFMKECRVVIRLAR